MWGVKKTNTAIPEKWFDLLGHDYLIPLIGLHWLKGCWEVLLFYRQVKFIKRSKSVPPQFAGKIHDYKAKRKTAISTHTFVIVSLSVTLGVKTLKLVTNYHPFVWGLTAYYDHTLDGRATWYAAFDEAFDGLVLLPLRLIGYMLFEKKPESTEMVFLAMVLETFIAAIFAAQTIMYLVLMTDSFGAKALFYGPLVANGIGLVFMGIYISCIVPRTAQKLLTSTTNEQLKEELVRMTSGVNYPVERIYVDDDIREANAYYSGIFGANMIAVSPKLMEITEGRSTAAIVAHELGHWAHHHNSEQLMFAVTSVLCMSIGWFWAYDNHAINQTFRFKDTPHAVIPVTLWIGYVSPLAMAFIAGINSIVGCSCEYTADAFTIPRGLGEALIDGLISVSASSRFYPFYDTWFSAWFNQHPTVGQRIARLAEAKQSAGGN